MQNERYVHRVGEAMVPTRHGEFRMIAYESEVDGESHVALMMGELPASISDEDPMLVRMHAHCLLGDVFGANSCECHATIDSSMRMIAQEGRGAVIYLLSDLNISRIRLLTNHPRRVAALEGFGIRIVEQVPVDIGAASRQSS
jgi:3,4-dihydroxy 2-butanone 4-phosphate synthase/GTP cyclohydrolase II